MNERRRHDRYSATPHLEVFERHSGIRLGSLADLSLEGFMLFCEQSQPADTVVECRLLLPQPLDGIDEIHLAADCLWSRPGAEGQSGWAGYQILDISEAHSAVLQKLMVD